MTPDITTTTRFDPSNDWSGYSAKVNQTLRLRTKQPTPKKLSRIPLAEQRKAFGIKAGGNTNLRVLLALAYRTHYGDKAFEN